MRKSQLFIQTSQPIVMVVACVSSSYPTLDLLLHVGTMGKIPAETQKAAVESENITR